MVLIWGSENAENAKIKGEEGLAGEGNYQELVIFN